MELNSTVTIVVSAVAFVIAFVGSIVGLVLGVLRLPVVLLVESKAPVAAGTNIGVSAVGALAGTYPHARENRIDLPVLVVMGSSGAIGAFLGGFLGGSVPSYVLLVMLGAILTYEGVGLARTEPIENHRFASHKPASTAFSRRRILVEFVLGFVIGFVGGMVGLILGSVRLPAMIRVLKMDTQKAVGTNLAIGALKGVFGFLGHLANGEVNLTLLSTMGIAAIFGSLFGANFTGRLSRTKLRMLIGYVLLVVAVAIFVQGYERYPH